MPGLDPGIQGVPLSPAVQGNLNDYVRRDRVDARVKPGHDGGKTEACHNFLWLTAYPDGYGVKPRHDGWKTATGVNE